MTEASGTMIYQGQAGHTYTFLALATDVAGNHEQPPRRDQRRRRTRPPSTWAPCPRSPARRRPTSASRRRRRSSPRPTRCSPRRSRASPTRRRRAIPPSSRRCSSRSRRSRSPPASTRATASSGPMALAQAPDGSFLVSGGAAPQRAVPHPRRTAARPAPRSPRCRTRSSRWPSTATAISGPTTGGGPLLQLDPTTGAIVNQFGDGITLALAVDPQTDADLRRHRRGRRDLRPDDRHLHPVQPRPEPARLEPGVRQPAATSGRSPGPTRARSWSSTTTPAPRSSSPSTRTSSRSPSAARARALDNLLFVSHDDAPNTPPGTVAPTPTELTMVDVATLQQVAVAQGGTRGFDVLATADGRLLDQPVARGRRRSSRCVPPTVVAVNPPAGQPSPRCRWRSST